MPTIRVNIKASASEPVPESLGGTFEVDAGNPIEVYRILRTALATFRDPVHPDEPNLNTPE